MRSCGSVWNVWRGWGRINRGLPSPQLGEDLIKGGENLVIIRPAAFLQTLGQVVRHGFQALQREGIQRKSCGVGRRGFANFARFGRKEISRRPPKHFADFPKNAALRHKQAGLPVLNRAQRNPDGHSKR